MPAIVDHVQHYVPRLLLRGFGTGTRKNRSLWRYDKLTNSIEQLHVKNCASDKGFYTFTELDGRVSCIDHAFNRHEDSFGNAILELRNHKDLRKLSSSHLSSIAFFVSLQFLRTPRIRKILKQQIINEPELQAQYLGTISEDHRHSNAVELELATRRFHADWILNNAGTHAKFLLEKSWVLRTHESRKLITSDHPVSMWYESGVDKTDWTDVWDKASLGLAISSELLIGFYNPRLVDDGTGQHAIKHYCLCDISDHEIQYFNELQFRFAERYIFIDEPVSYT